MDRITLSRSKKMQVLMQQASRLESKLIHSKARERIKTNRKPITRLKSRKKKRASMTM
jgi:hypothetical protein